MNLKKLNDLLSKIGYKNCIFVFGKVSATDVINPWEYDGEFPHPQKEAVWMQVQYPVVDRGIKRMAKGRRWIIEGDSSPWQIVATAFKAVLTVEEHEAREAFLYDGVAIFYPHHDLDQLVQIRKAHAAVAGTAEAEDNA